MGISKRSRSAGVVWEAAAGAEIVCKFPSEPAWATAFRADCIPLLSLGLLLALAGCASDLDVVLNTPVCQTSSISPTVPEHPMKCFLVFFKLLAHVAEGI